MGDEEEVVVSVPMIRPDELELYRAAMLSCAQGFLAAHANPQMSGLPYPADMADVCSAYAGALVIEYRMTEEACLQHHNTAQDSAPKAN